MNLGEKNVTYNDPYQTYVEGSFYSANPVRLVVALYEGAISAVQQARTCFDQGDIMGRGRAVTRAVSILAELIASLDQEKGGAVASNLKRLYDYMQRRLLEAHAKKSKEPLEEVDKLLRDLLHAWTVVAEQTATQNNHPAENATPAYSVPLEESESIPYGGYLYEPVDSFVRTAATF